MTTETGGRRPKNWSVAIGDGLKKAAKIEAVNQGLTLGELTELALNSMGIHDGGAAYKVTCNVCQFTHRGPWTGARRNAVMHESGCPDHIVTVWGPGPNDQNPRSVWGGVDR